jgi:hypothetical protein
MTVSYSDPEGYRGGVVALRALAAAGPRAGPASTLEQLPVTVHLVLYQGNDFALAVEVTEPDGQPADLTGATVLAQIRQAPQAPQVLGEFDPVIEDGGVIVVHLTAATSEALPPRQNVYDVTMTDDAGQVTTLIAGNITTRANVSRAQ